ncbi:MAG: ChaN family lipoprotein [Thermodesulfobacteriota bacterium]|nr:MAG: ChaN family lipoprotein [Thermodesulfobacteriota bacterium]
MKRIFEFSKIFLLLTVIGLISGGCLMNRVVRYPGGVDVPVKDLAGELINARAIFVGEFHEEWAHHRVQLRVIKALNEAGVDLAIGLEMFRADSQEPLDRWVRGDISEKDFRKEYHKNWNVSWYQYKGIFNYAKKNSIPLIGLNVPRSVSHKVFIGEVESLAPEERKMIGDITCNVDEKYEELIRDAIKEHVDTEAGYKSFCEVQMVWDNFMASQVVAYLDANPGKTMVVLSGSAHSWKRGIPRKVGELSGIRTLVVLPEAGEGFERWNITVDDTDYLWLDP